MNRQKFSFPSHGFGCIAKGIPSLAEVRFGEREVWCKNSFSYLQVILCCVTKLSGVQLQESTLEATRALGINHLSFVTFPPFFMVIVLEKM